MTLDAFYRLPAAEQDWEIARHEWESARCPKCRRPREECSDPEKVWYPQRTVCYATMEASASRARWERLHKDRPWHDGDFENWSEQPSAATPVHRDMGVDVWASESDLGQGGDFLRRDPEGEPGPDHAGHLQTEAG